MLGKQSVPDGRRKAEFQGFRAKQHYRRSTVTHIFAFAAINSSKNFSNVFFPSVFLQSLKKICCNKECIGNNKYYCYLLAMKAAGALFTSKEHFNL